MKSFDADYTLKELKDVARKYKAVVAFSYSRLTKSELAAELHKHLEHDSKGDLKLRKTVGTLKGYHDVKVLTKPADKEKREKGMALKKEARETNKRAKSEKKEGKKESNRFEVKMFSGKTETFDEFECKIL